MTIQYIFHSGFAVEGDRCILVFDYWLDPRHVMADLLKKGKPMYVFCSHHHEDHFSPEVLDRARQSRDICLIFSKDIAEQGLASPDEVHVWMEKGDVWSDGRIVVQAMGSNDCGVSWVVEMEGKTLFHAGDLNDWYARFLTDDAPACSGIVDDEGEEIDPVAEERRFLSELDDLARVKRRFDIVFFPVDGRIGNGYTRGARRFIERFEVGLFVPMHFVAAGFRSAWRMKEFTDARGIRFWSIGEVGERLQVEGG